MWDKLNYSKIWANTQTWFTDHVWTADTVYQLVILFIAIVLGWLINRVLRKRITNAIDSAEIPIRVKRIFNNLRRLIFHLCAVFFLFLGAHIAGSPAIGLDVKLSFGLVKVLLAWIVIRISLQFIANSLVRNIFAIAITSIAALSIFGILDETITALDAIGFSIGKFRVSALAVVKGMLSLFILLYLAMFASTFLERRVLKSKSLTRSSQVLLAKVIRITLIVFAILIGVTSAGIDLSIFAVLSGAIGLGIGFGLQKVVSNLFSGLLLLIDKSITPGDVIELQDSGTFGWVNHMGARYTEIITRDNKSFLIPNEDFITQRVINWSHGNRLIRLHVKFGVHYDSDPHKVIEICKAAATKPERVVETPNPMCWLMEFGDNSINFTLRFWIKDAEEGVANVKGEVMLALWDAFKENDIHIPYPHREVFIHKVEDRTV